MDHLFLLPAYGRSYKSTEEIQQAWDAGNDFKLYGSGSYCSIRDIDRLQRLNNHVTIVDPRTSQQLKVF